MNTHLFAILSSPYPVATVLLAALVLRERVIRIQAIGILRCCSWVLLIPVLLLYGIAPVVPLYSCQVEYFLVKSDVVS